MCQTGGFQVDALTFCFHEIEAQLFSSKKGLISHQIIQTQKAPMFCYFIHTYTQIYGNNVMSVKIRTFEMS